jgi:hypothetical protein
MKKFWKKFFIVLGSILTAGILLWIRSKSRGVPPENPNIEEEIDLHPKVEVKKKIDLRKKKKEEN